MLYSLHTMEREEIISNISRLPTVPLERIEADEHYEAHEVWEGDDGDAHYIASRYSVEGSRYEFIMLSLSGNVGDRQRMIREFCDVFGFPVDSETYPEENDKTDYLTWIYLPKQK